MRSNCIPAPRRMGNRHTLERLYHTSLVDQVENATRLSGLSHLILEPVIRTIGAFSSIGYILLLLPIGSRALCA